MFSDVLRDLFHSGLGVIRVAAERFFGVPRVTALPTAAVDYRGALARLEGGAGVADRAVICEKNTSDTYDWNDIGRAALDARYVNVTGDTMTGDLTAPTLILAANRYLGLSSGNIILVGDANDYLIYDASANVWQLVIGGSVIFSASASTTTLTAPTFTNFTNAQHDHGDADDGGVITGMASVTLGPWFLANLSGTASNQAMNLPNMPTTTTIAQMTVGAAAYFRMPLAGRVIGGFLNSGEARTAGTATLRVDNGGVTSAFASGACVLNGTDTARASAWDSAGPTFAAGDAIRPVITTSGWTPTTADVTAWLVVRFDP